jgi:CxC5 like cysteine cluster associated with KDZ transposases/CxC6 like cysteine cluster associated with KDZ transposases
MTLPVLAASSENPFQNILFSDFNHIIESTLGSKVTLATVLTVLFSLTENPDLLNLHFCQQHPTEMGENRIKTSGWITALVNTLTDKLGEKRSSTLFFGYEHTNDLWDNKNKRTRNKLVAEKLDRIANTLYLSPYDENGNYKGKLLPISHKNIQPALVICPSSFVCGTLSCRPRSLTQSVQDSEIPLVTLVKNHKIYKNIPVLTGMCNICHTSYSADHERFKDSADHLQSWKQVCLNSAKYIKLGQTFWVDRAFSLSVVNAMYNFHASSSAFVEYWNNTFGTKSTYIGQRHVWQAFVHESMRTIGQESNVNVEVDDNPNIKHVTEKAFSILGANGIIRAATNHACSECTQKYRKPSNSSENNDHASSKSSGSSTSNSDMDVDKSFVNMVVLDGIVMGHTYCAYDNCQNQLNNSRGGSLCDVHHLKLGSYCLVRDCNNRRVVGTSACQDHQPEWKIYKKYSTHNARSGVRRMLQCPAESYAWQPRRRGPNTQRHDDPSSDPPLPKNFFSPARIYCVETLCAPCGVPIAWAKFARSESTTNVLNFLGTTYVSEESRPDYVCIDKACQVLATAVTNGSWDIWK